jgi:very-short-patch-repair endonuclease
MDQESIDKKQRHFRYKQAKIMSIAEEYQSTLLEYPTQAEKHIENLLKELDYKYLPQKIILGPGRFWIADIYLQDYNLIIELDGYQHSTPTGLSKDLSRDQSLKDLGFTKTLRIFNDQAVYLTSDTLNTLILGALNQST